MVKLIHCYIQQNINVYSILTKMTHSQQFVRNRKNKKKKRKYTRCQLSSSITVQENLTTIYSNCSSLLNIMRLKI